MVIDNIYPRLAMLCGSELELKLKPLGELAFLHFKSDQSAASLCVLLMLTTRLSRVNGWIECAHVSGLNRALFYDATKLPEITDSCVSSLTTSAEPNLSFQCEKTPPRKLSLLERVGDEERTAKLWFHGSLCVQVSCLCFDDFGFAFSSGSVLCSSGLSGSVW
jgi:hypothetical protein